MTPVKFVSMGLSLRDKSLASCEIIRTDPPEGCMEPLFTIIAVIAFVLGGIATLTAFGQTGSDIQLILGALYGLCGITSLATTALLVRLKSLKPRKEELPQ